MLKKSPSLSHNQDLASLFPHNTSQLQLIVWADLLENIFSETVKGIDCVLETEETPELLGAAETISAEPVPAE